MSACLTLCRAYHLWRAELATPRMAAHGRTGAEEQIGVDQLNKWFWEVSETPIGSVVLFVGVFLTRIAIDQWSRKRETKRKPKRKGNAHSGSHHKHA